MRKIVSGVLAWLCMALVPGAIFADEEKEAAKINVRFLLQPQVQMTQDASVGRGWEKDFFLRRARVILTGKVNDWVHFFYETDNADFGKGGNFDYKLVTQDAYVDFQFAKELSVAAGLILLPFTHHTRQSAGSLNTLDYHNMFSGGEYGLITGHVWRDMGIEARGFIADKLEYRVGVYNGLRGKTVSEELKKAGVADPNPDDMPRYVGRVALNLLDKEETFFYGGTYLGAKKIVTIGIGADFQPDATYDEKGNLASYWAASGDLFVDWPINDKMEVVAQLGGLWFDKGMNPLPDAQGGVNYVDVAGTGMGYYGEVGFRYAAFEPVIGGERFLSDAPDGDFMNLRGGLNYWIKGHNANVKLEYAAIGKENKTKADEIDYSSQVTLQVQLLF